MTNKDLLIHLDTLYECAISNFGYKKPLIKDLKEAYKILQGLVKKSPSKAEVDKFVEKWATIVQHEAMDSAGYKRQIRQLIKDYIKLIDRKKSD